MTAFLSTTNIAPYNSISLIPTVTDVEIDAVEGAEVVNSDNTMYLVVTEQMYETIEIRVENENSSGTSLYISEVDIMNVPTGWHKLLTLSDIDASETDQVIQLAYRWSIINNVHILKHTKISGTINIYEV